MIDKETANKLLQAMESQRPANGTADFKFGYFYCKTLVEVMIGRMVEDEERVDQLHQS